MFAEKLHNWSHLISTCLTIYENTLYFNTSLYPVLYFAGISSVSVQSASVVSADFRNSFATAATSEQASRQYLSSISASSFIVDIL